VASNQHSMLIQCHFGSKFCQVSDMNTGRAIFLNWSLFSLLAVLDSRLLSPYLDHLPPHLSKLQTVLFNMPFPAFGINSLTLFVSLIHILVFSPSHYPTQVGSTLSSPSLSPSIAPSLFHSRLKTPFLQVFSTLDFTIDTLD